MSTDWIKMRVDLRTHPKVVRMASALKADKLRVIGGLFAVWSIFDAHAVDGTLEGYNFREIDEQLGWKGFAAAMSGIDWLTDSGDALDAPRFEEHNGQSAKRRAMETERKRVEREAEKSAADAAKAATKAGQLSASRADKNVTREEKRREEKEKETSNLTVAPARPSADQPVGPAIADQAKPKNIPDCPHGEVLALWAEVLPAMPQHLPDQWRGARSDHLRVRWRETAEAKGWADKAQGLTFFRKLFGYVGQSQFLTGRSRQNDPNKRPFVAELEWLVLPANWAKTLEGKYHQDAA